MSTANAAPRSRPDPAGSRRHGAGPRRSAGQLLVSGALRPLESAGSPTLVPGLKRLLQRYADPSTAVIGVDCGWHPIIVELDETLAAIDPTYSIVEISHRMHGLRYVALRAEAECCRAWSLEPHGPGMQRRSDHEASARHLATMREQRYVDFYQAILDAEAVAACTCERCGRQPSGPGGSRDHRPQRCAPCSRVLGYQVWTRS